MRDKVEGLLYALLIGVAFGFVAWALMGAAYG